MNAEAKICKKCGGTFTRNTVLYPGNFKRMQFCGNQCMQSSKKYTPEKAQAVFWSRVDKNAPNGCWHYMGARDKWGYGDISYLRKHVQAHRLVWKLLRSDPGELDVLHKCNNPPCCNPDHLYLGTDMDNAADRIKAGTVLRGEALYNAKLTEEIVRELRRNPPDKRGGRKRKAAELGITPHYLYQILIGRSWKHIL